MAGLCFADSLGPQIYDRGPKDAVRLGRSEAAVYGEACRKWLRERREIYELSPDT